jgi:uncharacterized repeat protein (TIGR03803 family)
MRRLPAILFRPLAIMAMALSAVFCNHAFAQAREVVLYSFGSNPNDGDIPNGGLVFDSSGNLYGTTQRGGAYGGGTVFELTPTLAPDAVRFFNFPRLRFPVALGPRRCFGILEVTLVAMERNLGAGLPGILRAICTGQP